MNNVWQVEFDERAAKELKKLGHQAQKDILDFFKTRIATSEDPMRFGKSLTANLVGLWRYRIGDYRVICQIQHDKLIVLALKVGHRREVYR